MGESILKRVQRVVAGGFESAVDAAERASAPSLMRQSIREMDCAVRRAERETKAARSRRLLAERQRAEAADEHKALTEQARFALAQGRDDLAQAALTRQLEVEARISALEAAASDDDERRLADAVGDLKRRKQSMEKELAAFETARRGAAAEARSFDDQAARAEEAFARFMQAADGIPAARSGDQVARHIDEIDALRREAVISERLSALRQGAPSPGPRAKKGKSSR